MEVNVNLMLAKKKRNGTTERKWKGPYTTTAEAALVGEDWLSKRKDDGSSYLIFNPIIKKKSIYRILYNQSFYIVCIRFFFFVARNVPSTRFPSIFDFTFFHRSYHSLWRFDVLDDHFTSV